MEIKEGMVLDYNTCDAFDPIYGTEYNKHVEKVLIVQIKNENVKLYNLTTGHHFKLEMHKLKMYVKAGIYTLTNETA